MTSWQIAVKWLTMPLHHKLEIANQIGHLHEGDYMLGDIPLFKALIERSSKQIVTNAIETFQP